MKKLFITVISLFLFMCSVSADTCDVSDSNAFCLVTDDNIHVEIEGKNYFGSNLEEGEHPGVTYFKISEKDEILYCSNGVLSTSSLTDPLEPIDQACVEKVNNKMSLIYSYEYGYNKYQKNNYNFNSKYLTGDYIKDYYITQTAVWNFCPPVEDYLLEFWESKWFKNYNFETKTFNGEQNDMTIKISDFINDATSAANGEASLNLVSDNTLMNISSDGKYYISDGIKVVGKYLSKDLNLVVEGIDGAFVTTDKYATSGINRLEYEVNPSVQKVVYVKVPVENVTKTDINIKLTVTSESAFNDNSKIIECNPRKNSSENRIQPMIKYVPSYVELESEITLSAKKYEVKISKTDNDGNFLSGATLVVKQDGNEIVTWNTSNDVKTIFLAPGVYTLEEVKAPAGYILNNGVITFTVDNDDEKINEVSIKNDPIIITISKKSVKDDAELEGAKLRITDKDGNVVKDINGVELEWISSSKPKSFHVIAGTYVLEEVEAPDGYELSDKKIEFVVREDGVVTIKEGLLIKKDVELEDNLIVFENTPVPEQVKTGNTIIYIAGVLCLISLGVSVYFIIKRKEI